MKHEERGVQSWIPGVLDKREEAGLDLGLQMARVRERRKAEGKSPSIIKRARKQKVAPRVVPTGVHAVIDDTLRKAGVKPEWT